MASFRPYPPAQSFAPPPPPPPPSHANQDPIPPPPSAPAHQQQYHYSGNTAPAPLHPSSNYSHFPSGPAPFNPHHRHPHQQQQQQQWASQTQPPAQHPPPPPPPVGNYPAQPPPPPQSMYYHQPPPPANLPQPPPPPPSSPPNPPPPPKEPAPPAHPSGSSAKPVLPLKPPKGLPGRVETEEERKARKRKEYEKQKEDKKRQMQKQLQANVQHKPQVGLSSGAKPGHGHVSVSGSRMAEKRATPLLNVERAENRLKKPTTFLCKLRFRNELPDPTAQPKLLSLNTNNDRYTKYAITSLEKLHKPRLYTEQDLGIPLDLLDLSVYNPPDVHQLLDPEDEELLRDTVVVTPTKPQGIRRKERPTDKGVSWLVKTQYISPLSTDAAKMSLTEKQAKEIRETKEGKNLFLENLNNREKQIQAIEESFKVSKLPPVHQTKRSAKPEQILPLLPYFDRYEDRFVMVTFDGDPTADSEKYNKLAKEIREKHESQAIMKSFVVNGSDPSKPEKFLAYMVPAPDELSKDAYDEREDVSYSWLREYHWDVRGDDADDPKTYLVNFDERAARYLPLPTKLVLQKKKKEGRTGDEIEHYPVPARITLRRRDVVSVEELKDFHGMSSNHDNVGSINLKRGGFFREDELERQSKLARTSNHDQFSAEEDMSD